MSSCDKFKLVQTLGAGKRLFGETATATALRMVDAWPAGETLILTYEPAANDRNA